MFTLGGIAAALALAGAMAVQNGTSAGPPAALERLGVMVGGEWVGEAKDASGKPFASLRFEWGPGRKSIRGSGTIAGAAVESRLAWDAAAKKVYYVDFHGPETVYFGHYSFDGDAAIVDFKTLVGAPGAWHTRATWPDRDTYVATIRPVVDGKLKEGHEVRLRRVR